MSERIHVAVSEAPLSLLDAFAFAEDQAHGAVASFIGRVRNHNEGRPVLGVSYDVYGALALRTFEKIAREAAERWGENLRIWLEHFKGRLDIGGLSVVIVVSSSHRNEAFLACRYIIEEIKTRSPVWKLEHYTDGDSGWVRGHALCKC
jgi:molybdopterin synthase catalytic subunit